MNGAIEGMLAVLEDPRAEQADAAASGLVDRYYREGPDALRPYKVRFRKMLGDRDPGVRRVAAWALAHTGDMDIVLSLIDALTDPDEDVVEAARLGLQVISRKIDGLGPPRTATPEQRKEAAARWREWYNAIKPLDLDDEGNP
jgi:HEAT repeat protein